MTSETITPDFLALLVQAEEFYEDNTDDWATNSALQMAIMLIRSNDSPDDPTTSALLDEMALIADLLLRGDHLTAPTRARLEQVKRASPELFGYDVTAPDAVDHAA